MKIFGRFHYVWYLVSVPKGGRLSYSVCRLMLVTVCQWLFIVTASVCLVVVLLLECFLMSVLHFLF